MTLPAGSTIAEFEVIEVLGGGGFGVVYLARDLLLDRRVALKEYMPARLAARRADETLAFRNTQDEVLFEMGKRSFINEARLLAQFDHPALAKIYRFWEERGTAYIVMPYYQGHTLRTHLDEHPRPTEDWLRRLLDPLLDALGTLHAHHCWHRDVAPDNILLLESGRPMLLDFGAARQVIGQATHELTAILKPGYAPVEQYSDDQTLRQGPWTDIYALSAVLYTAIAGKPPKPSVNRMLENDHVRASDLGLPGYSRSFLAAIDAGLALMPQERPQSAAEFARLLARPDSGDEFTLPVLPGDRRPPPAQQPPRAPARTDPLMMLGGSFLAVAVAALGWWVFVRAPESTGAGPSPPGTAASAGIAVEPPASLPATDSWQPIELVEQVAKGGSASLGLDLVLQRREVRVGEPMEMSIKVRAPGYLYVLSIPEHSRNVVLVFPNAEDRANRVRAGDTVTLPRAGWHLQAGEPPERLHLLGVLSATPRSFDAPRFSAAEPFATADLAAARAEALPSVAQWLIGAPRDCAGGACAAYGAAAVVLDTRPR